MTPHAAKRRPHLAADDDPPPPRPFWAGWVALAMIGVWVVGLFVISMWRV